MDYTYAYILRQYFIQHFQHFAANFYVSHGRLKASLTLKAAGTRSTAARRFAENFAECRLRLIYHISLIA